MGRAGVKQNREDEEVERAERQKPTEDSEQSSGVAWKSVTPTIRVSSSYGDSRGLKIKKKVSPTSCRLIINKQLFFFLSQVANSSHVLMLT